MPFPLDLNPKNPTKIIKLGPLFLVGSEFLKRKDPRIPPLFDQIIEKLGDYLIDKYRKNEKIQFIKKLINFTHYIEDLTAFFKSFLNYVLEGLIEEIIVN